MLAGGLSTHCPSVANPATLRTWRTNTTSHGENAIAAAPSADRPAPRQPPQELGSQQDAEHDSARRHQREQVGVCGDDDGERVQREPARGRALEREQQRESDEQRRECGQRVRARLLAVEQRQPRHRHDQRRSEPDVAPVQAAADEVGNVHRQRSEDGRQEPHAHLAHAKGAVHEGSAACRRAAGPCPRLRSRPPEQRRPSVKTAVESSSFQRLCEPSSAKRNTAASATTAPTSHAHLRSANSRRLLATSPIARPPR